MSSEYFRLNNPVTQTKSPGLSWRLQLVVFAIAALAVISRRPDAITNPQFFAEDGAVWFADAYRLGFHSLFVPDAGYLQIFPRLIAGLAVLVPLIFAPLLMNMVGIVVQVLPVNLLASARFADWGSLPLRLVMGFLYIALPNSRELDVVITNAQWHLALLACILVLASSPVTWKWRVFDICLLLLSGLTGPFCLLLLPIAVIMWWMRRSNWRIVTSLVVAGCALAQLLVLYRADPSIRYSAPLGATTRLFIDLLSGHVFLAAMFGFSNYSERLPFTFLVLVALLGLVLFAYALLRTKLEIRLFVLFSLLVFAASLRSPLVSRSDPQWQVLDHAYGIRYWFFPMLGFLWSVVWLAQPGKNKWLRSFALAVIALMIFGIAKDWEYPAFSDHNFAQYAREFERMPSGKAMVFPLYPDGWTMQLVKGSRNCQTIPAGYVDQPNNGSVVAGQATLQGWVAASEPVAGVTVYLDGNFVETLVPNISRQDVDQKYPSSSTKNKGWRGALDLSRQRPGSHVIEIRARLKDGCESVLGVRSVEIKPH